MKDESGFSGFKRTGVDAGHEPRDRIFLSNHVRDFEIGAYTEEFGVTQRVRFDVMLDVRTFEITDDDEVASIVSYDLIVESIDKLIEGPRIKLVETVAERLAALVLEERRVIAAHIRIEKLDRVVGSLGVEITRSQPAAP